MRPGSMRRRQWSLDLRIRYSFLPVRRMKKEKPEKPEKNRRKAVMERKEKKRKTRIRTRKEVPVPAGFHDVFHQGDE